MKTGRTTFYGGAPDHMNPSTASFGTLDGSCGCEHDSQLCSGPAREIPRTDRASHCEHVQP